MENITQLLEKYFQASTTLLEEKLLKSYFEGNEVQAEHEQYRCLFVAFETELHQTLPSKDDLQLKKSVKINKYVIHAIISTGIAACLLIGFWVIQPQPEVENYAIVNGEMNADSDFAEKYVEEKLNKVNTVVTKNMKPIQTLNIVKKRLQPIQKLKADNRTVELKEETTKNPIK